jgi:hypothetical protein
MDQIRFLKGDEVSALRAKVQSHRKKTLQENLGRIVEAYKVGETPEEKESLIGKAMDKAHTSRAKRNQANAPKPSPSEPTK